LKKLYNYGFSKERSEVSTVSLKLLSFIIYCQKKSSIRVCIMIMNDYARVKNKKLLNILKQICFSVRKAIKDHSKKFV